MHSATMKNKVPNLIWNVDVKVTNMQQVGENRLTDEKKY